jgi:hypothetical protein
MNEHKPIKTEFKIDFDKIKKRRDFTFYSNLASVTRSEIDCQLDFMQFPSEGDLVPDVKIFMTIPQAKKLLDALQNVLAGSSEGISLVEETK